MPSRKLSVKSPASLASVAKVAGVSTATVSLVLSGRHRDYGVSDDTADRIRHVAERQGYQRPPRRRGAPRLHVVHVEDLLRMNERGLGGSILHPLIETVTARGWQVTIDMSLPSEPSPDMLSASAVLIPVNHGFDTAAHELVVAAAKAGVQPLVLGRHFSDVTAIQIDGDQQGGGKLAAEFLLGQGHRTMAVIGGIAGDPHSDARLAGFLATTKRVAKIWLWGDGQYTVADAHRVASEQLKKDRSITAVFCANDRMAFGVLLAAREAGLSVPGDLSVVGFDDQSEFVQVAPGLTTIRLVPDRIGAELATVIEPGPKLRSLDLTMPARLIVRGSTAAPRSSP